MCHVISQITQRAFSTRERVGREQLLSPRGVPAAVAVGISRLNPSFVKGGGDGRAIVRGAVGKLAFDQSHQIRGDRGHGLDAKGCRRRQCQGRYIEERRRGRGCGGRGGHCCRRGEELKKLLL